MLLPLLPSYFLSPLFLGVSCFLFAGFGVLKKTYPFYPYIACILVGIALVLHLLNPPDPFEIFYFHHFTTNRFIWNIQSLLLLCAFLYQVVSHPMEKDSALLEKDLLILLSLLSSYLLLNANYLLMIYVFLELTGFSLMALFFYPTLNRLSMETLTKWFLLSFLQSIVLLAGIVGLAALTSPSLSLTEIVNGLSVTSTFGVRLSMVGIFIGLAFKLGLFPFHWWLPDVYESASSDMLLWYTTLPKIVYAGFIWRVLSLCGSVSWVHHFWWSLAISSILLGSLAALPQTNVRRLLGYSSIAQMGQISLTMLLPAKNSVLLFLFYLCGYITATYLAFYLLTSEEKNASMSIKHSPLSQNRTLLYRGWFAIALFSISGLPPLIGFQNKLWLWIELWKAGWIPTVFISLFASFLSLFYHFRIALKYRPLYGKPSIGRDCFVFGLGGILILFGCFPELFQIGWTYLFVK